MVKILWLFILLAIVSCKTTQTTTTKTQVLSDTLIRHEVNVVTPAVRNYTLINNPCKDGELKPIDQLIENENSSVSIRNIDGNLAVEVNIDSIVNSRVEEIIKSKNDTTTETVKTITRTRIPSWAWYVFIYTALVTVYTFRRFIPYINLIP